MSHVGKHIALLFQPTTIGRYLRRWPAWLSCAALALLVVGPWLRPGYVLTLDMIFTPTLHLPHVVDNTYIFRIFLHALNFVIPSQLIEKIILFLIFFLSSFGMYRLLRQLFGQGQVSDYQKVGASVASTLYAINPFTYDRLMAGQYLVLLGYALIPFFVMSLRSFAQKPSVWRSVRLAGWATLIGAVSIHTLGMLFVLILAAIGVYVRLSQHKLLDILRFGGMTIAVFVAANSYWLLPLVIGKGSLASQIHSFGPGDLAAFATEGSTLLAKVGNVLQLQGFWLASHDLYLRPAMQVPSWHILALLMWVLVVLGLVVMWRQQRRSLALWIGSVVVVGALLATGYFSGVLQHLPLYDGYREPQKFAALVAFGFCVCVAHGVAGMLGYLKREAGTTFTAVMGSMALALPLVLTAVLLWGCHGQLSSRTYPAEWTAANAQLNRDPSDFQVLFLPWHLYMRFGFSGRIIANPAPLFFDKTTIVSDDAELDGAAPSGATAATQQLDQLLAAAPRHNQARAFAKLNIKYILLVNDNDYRDYAYLSRWAELKPVRQNAALTLYQNAAWRSP